MKYFKHSMLAIVLGLPVIGIADQVSTACILKIDHIATYDFNHAVAVTLLPRHFLIDTSAGGEWIIPFESGSSGVANIGGIASFNHRIGDTVWFDIVSTSGQEPASGDFIQQELVLPDKETKDALFELSCHGIELTDVYGELFFDRWAYIEGVEEDYNGYLNQMIQDIHFTASEMRGTMEEPFIDAGIFKDQLLFEAMEATTVQDLNFFMEYIRWRPYKYQATKWKISEIYATWLVNGSPVNPDAFFETWQQSSPPERKGMLERYHTLFTDDFRDDLEESATLFYQLGLTTEGDQYYQMMLEEGALEEETDATIGWIYFGQGESLRNASMDNRAVEAYLNAANSFHRAKEGMLEAVMYNNAGNQLMDETHGKVARQHFVTAKKLIEKINDRESAAILAPIHIMIVSNIGYTYYLEADLKRALAFYKEAEAFIPEETTRLLLKKMSNLYARMALAYIDLGQNDSASFYNEKFKVIDDELDEWEDEQDD